MNSGTTLDTLVPLNACCAETQTYDSENNNTGETPSAACDLFEGGLGI
jgi:hypothetical protein